jgi:hypothetical protein
MSIIFHHYKQLTKLLSEQLEDKEGEVDGEEEQELSKEM